MRDSFRAECRFLSSNFHNIRRFYSPLSTALLSSREFSERSSSRLSQRERSGGDRVSSLVGCVHHCTSCRERRGSRREHLLGFFQLPPLVRGTVPAMVSPSKSALYPPFVTKGVNLNRLSFDELSVNAMTENLWRAGSFRAEGGLERHAPTASRQILFLPHLLLGFRGLESGPSNSATTKWFVQLHRCSPSGFPPHQCRGAAQHDCRTNGEVLTPLHEPPDSTGNLGCLPSPPPMMSENSLEPPLAPAGESMRQPTDLQQIECFHTLIQLRAKWHAPAPGIPSDLLPPTCC